MYDSFSSFGVSKPKIEFRIKKRLKKNDSSMINSGGAIILVIFVVLCLTIFGLLSFTTSFADKKLADRNMLYVEQFYKADAAAETRLYEIAGDIKTALIKGGESEFDEKFVLAALNNKENTEVWREEDGIVKVEFQCELNSMQAVQVQADFIRIQAEKQFEININTWKVVMTKPLEYAEPTYNIWNGE